MFIAFGTRSFGAVDFAPVSVLWSFWAISVAIFTFPIQHWIIRRLRLSADHRQVWSALPAIVGASLATAVALSGVAFVFRDSLFGTVEVTWPLLVGLVTLGSALLGFIRGMLAGRDRFFAASIAIAGENLVRLAGGLLVIGLAGGVVHFGAALVLGPLIGILWPEVFIRERGRPRDEGALAFLGGIAGGILIAQIVLNAGPVFLSSLGGEAADVTSLFAALALFRAPYLIALGVATRVTGPLTGLVATGDSQRLRLLLRWGVLATTVFSALGGLFGYWAGGPVLRLVFGDEIVLSAGITSEIAGGSVVALGGLFLTLVLIARGKSGAIVGAWIAALIGGGLGVLAGTTPLSGVVHGFLIAEVVAFFLMSMTEYRHLAVPRVETI